MTADATSSKTIDLLCLWYQVNASLSAYHKLIQKFGSATAALAAKPNQWVELGIHKKHIERKQNDEQSRLFIQQVQNNLVQGNYQLICIDDNDYPAQLKQIYDPPPVLFVKGNSHQLNNSQIAMVGSRKPSPHAQKISFDMAQYLAQSGYVITSGLAQGVDKQAHLGALTQDDNHAKGRTIGVLGTGIDVVYPRHHEALFKQILNDGGCLVTELLPSTPASRHTFPRRNRLVAGLSLGTIVTEATINSGSLITARLTSDQGKQVFAVPSHIDNANAEGCHHLIREGATLIYHPQQVIDDLQYQGSRPVSSIHQQPNQQTAKQATTHSAHSAYSAHSTHTAGQQQQPSQSQSHATIKLDKTADLPTHLQPLYKQLDWSGVDLDSLVTTLQLDTQTLLGQLMELELMGVVIQQGGRYLRA